MLNWFKRLIGLGKLEFAAIVAGFSALEEQLLKLAAQEAAKAEAAWTTVKEHTNIATIATAEKEKAQAVATNVRKILTPDSGVPTKAK